MPKSLSHIAVAGEIADMGAAGVLGLLQPLFRFLARRAKKDGTEQALLERYCTPPADVEASAPRRPPE